MTAATAIASAGFLVIHSALAHISTHRRKWRWAGGTKCYNRPLACALLPLMTIVTYWLHSKCMQRCCWSHLLVITPAALRKWTKFFRISSFAHSLIDHTPICSMSLYFPSTRRHNRCLLVTVDVIITLNFTARMMNCTLAKPRSSVLMPLTYRRMRCSSLEPHWSSRNADWCESQIKGECDESSS